MYNFPPWTHGLNYLTSLHIYCLILGILPLKTKLPNKVQVNFT